MGWPSLVLGVLGNILSLSVKPVALVPTFWRIYKKGTTEEFLVDPYVASLMNGMLWLYYGILDPHGLSIATVSGVGCGVQVFYISIYFWFASKKQRVRVVSLVGLACTIVGAVVVTTMLLARAPLRLSIVGIITDITTIVVYSSLLTIMGHVVKTKSVEFMPFLPSLFLCLNGGTWMAYGITMQDLFIEVPYAIGFLLGVIQLILFIRFWKPIKHAYKDDLCMQVVHTIDIEKIDIGNHIAKKLENFDIGNQMAKS
ncbi:hypothetical protein GOP47_0016773 [Adiantum capillus-veneris]|uniref:Bidirectional sugar transporter SWEET n=1 Tax=Adiantum capillus-veneris TaxID=13818 RepID=A0A9D4UIB3_ADICA|nr:hypothetical protein GOP47_0016773 [Adiantum capillus-veneris]